MDNLYLVLAGLAVIGLVAFMLLSRRRIATAPARHAKKADNLDTVTGWHPQSTRVLSNVERKAFETLRSAFPAHIILAQVPLARFIKVPTRNSYAEWLRRAGQLCADLVVCDRYSQVIAVVELRRDSDSSHARHEKRQLRLMRVLKAAQVPVHEWSEHAMPSVDQAREAIMPTPPAPAESAPSTTAPAVVPAVAAAAAVPAAASFNPLTEEERDSTQDEVIEMREPPPSTWFDEMDSEPAAFVSRTGRDDPPPRR